jgi:hypothetical protein
MIPLAIEDRHASLQRSFAEAVMSGDAPIPAAIRLASGPAAASRFGVYRNNVLASLINALAARYPISRSVLWPDTFEGAARLFVNMHPPHSPVLLHYGEGFPGFLRDIGIGPSAEYIADLAELESARVRAYHAADATPLSLEALNGLPPDALPDLRFNVHPSVSFIRSRFPIVSVWEAAHAGAHADVWKAEAALIARPQLDVQVWRLPPGGYEFFSAIACGCTVGGAVATGTEHDAQFDLAAAFSIMMCAGAVTGIAGAGASDSFG